MTIDDSFDTHFKHLLTFVDRKVDRYKYTVKNANLHCTIYKTISKKTIEFPVTRFNQEKQKESINDYFATLMMLTLQKHYSVFSPIIESINFTLIIEINENKEIIDLYYKVAFFTHDKNIIIRLLPNENMDVYLNRSHKTINIEESKHKVVNHLFKLSFDNDFIFDSNGITLIEMLSI